jgi:hypothetical protein
LFFFWATWTGTHLPGYKNLRGLKTKKINLELLVE